MRHCKQCLPLGYCKAMTNYVVTEAEMTQALMKDVRAFTSGLGVSPSHWPEKLVADYRDYQGRIWDKSKNEEAALNTELLFFNPQIANDNFDLSLDLPLEKMDYRTWYRDNLNRCSGLYVRLDNKARWQVVLTILRITYPKQSYFWGVRAANDNFLQYPSPPKCG